MLTVLKGPDRVRLRHRLVFPDGSPTKAPSMVAQVFFTEAAWGFCRKIDVCVHADGGVTVYGSGRGIVLDDGETEADMPLWAYIFTALHAAPATRDERYEAAKRRLHSRLFGGAAEGVDTLPLVGEAWFDWCCVQLVSSYMRVESVRGGVKTVRCFAGGYPQEGVAVSATDEPDGTRIAFMPDAAVFGGQGIDYEALAALLQPTADGIVGLQCTLQKDARPLMGQA